MSNTFYVIINAEVASLAVAWHKTFLSHPSWSCQRHSNQEILHSSTKRLRGGFESHGTHCVYLDISSTLEVQYLLRHTHRQYNITRVDDTVQAPAKNTNVISSSANCCWPISAVPVIYYIYGIEVCAVCLLALRRTNCTSITLASDMTPHMQHFFATSNCIGMEKHDLFFVYPVSTLNTEALSTCFQLKDSFSKPTSRYKVSLAPRESFKNGTSWLERDFLSVGLIVLQKDQPYFSNICFANLTDV